MILQEIVVYPVKSMRGCSLASTRLVRTGPEHDRCWMVVDASGRFLTQRELPRLARIAATMAGDTLVLACGVTSIAIAAASCAARSLRVRVWDDEAWARDCGDNAADWLSSRLGTEVRLVTMAPDSQRAVDPAYAPPGATVGFADGFPLLLISQASLDDLNARLRSPVPMNRFRPNLVVTGCEAFAEDRWRRIRIGGLELDVVKPCTRCVVPSIDQLTGDKHSEVLRVLAGYRRGPDRQTRFGQNLVHRGTGTLAVGDHVEVLAEV